MSHIFVSTVTVLRIFLANKTYMGMIYLDYRENNVNSMMNAFCHILLEQCKDKRLNTEPSCCGQTQSPETDNDLQSVTGKCTEQKSN